MSNSTTKPSFTEINLSDIQRKKTPKRLVYFSDGILEEYSSDEDEVDHSNLDEKSLVDPQTLSWIPYFAYLFWRMGTRTLSVCDYLGENLAWFLGITTPKFQYELEQYKKLMKEEEDLKKEIDAESAGWCSVPAETVAEQPHVEILSSNDKEQLIKESLLDDSKEKF